MSRESHKLIARRFLIDTFSGGKLEILDEILAPDYLDHDSPLGTPPGREGIRYLMGTFDQAFPDLHFTIEDQIVEEDKVLTRWIFRSAQTGEL